MLWYNHMCLLIWTVFSDERCGPWSSCCNFWYITLNFKNFHIILCCNASNSKNVLVYVHRLSKLTLYYRWNLEIWIRGFFFSKLDILHLEWTISFVNLVLIIKLQKFGSVNWWTFNKMFNSWKYDYIKTTCISAILLRFNSTSGFLIHKPWICSQLIVMICMYIVQ